ncbi:hypothetical protein LCGC14_1078180 [marine sediment metagenome]|uniref:Formyl transferase N-terminal domain-containing protein n=1 Tax=marine sediment metagenome TaxID=412755 RepID=A0A0F9QLX1_9ZZZZ
MNVIVTIKSWNITKAKDLGYKVVSNLDDIKSLNPRYIFFPYWSRMIPKEIYENFECVVFHMTDLPYGRGGSPLQNLIVRGFKETKISAIRVTGGIDAGPVYMKDDLSLEGTADEILTRAADIIFNMIPKIVGTEPTPQEGTVTEFTRRVPQQGNLNINWIGEVDSVYDHIRMLDGEGCPPAFIKTNKYRIEFTGAKQENGYVTATVKIY